MSDLVTDEGTHAGPADPLVGTTVAKRYRIDRLLGAGGMGAVYKAEHTLMRKTVALKVLHKELTYHEEIVARFEREAIAAGRIEHPCVATATDFGRLEDGSFYLVLEYIDGKSLAALVEQGPLAVGRALAIARQIASALSAAHGAGIVHRDLKTDNVMVLSGPGGVERVKVLDFGIAKVAAPGGDARTQLTRIGTVMGTAAYMSPEQALGQPVDHRTDLYALGIILHEMIAGRPPFDADEVAQVLAQQITQPPPPLPDGTPAETSRLVQDLLQKKPDDRPQGATEVVERIDRLLGQRGSAAGAAAAAPVSVRTGAGSVDVAQATVLDAALDDAPSPQRKRSWGWAALAVGLLALGALGVMMTGDDEPADLPSAASPAATPERTESARSEGPKTPANQASPAPKPTSTQTSRVETSSSRSVTRTPDGTKVTRSTNRTKRTSTRRSSTKRRSKKKRRTGPGGIYIPPPREWF